MSISLKSDASGNSGAIQVAGVDRLTLNTDSSLVAGANPATGTRSMALATMQMFANEFGASLAANGYQKLPSGLIIQWGSANYAAGVRAVVYPIAFPTATRSIQLTLQASGVGSYSNNATGDISTTGFTAYQNSPVNSPFFWIAIGY